AVHAIARHEPGRGVVHLEGGAVRATDFEAAEATFEIGEEFAERGVVVVEVRVPVIAQRERREDTGDHAVVERAFGLDVDVTRNELHSRVVERRARKGTSSKVVRVDDVEASGDRTTNRDGERIARKRRTGDETGGDESGRPKESLFHVFLAVSALSCSIRTRHSSLPPGGNSVTACIPGRLMKLPPERVHRLIRG